ncbi:MAG: hypothetical protein KC656_29465, partial [Myxococcales bacterium]|nr:hypothetical protein [Myxococcales bacterium]
MDTERFDMTLLRDELPVGPIREHTPARQRARRFGVAIPSLAVMFLTLVATGVFLVFAGAHGWLTDGLVWTPGLVVGTLLAL